MTDRRISQATSTDPLQDDDLVPLARVGDTTARMATVAAMRGTSVQSPVTVPSGASFPVGPIAGARFYRNDLRTDCLYTGTLWQSVRPHILQPDEINNVLGAWSLSQNNGSVAYDSSKRAHDLTLNASPTINQLSTQISTMTLNGSSQYLSSTHADFAPAAAGSFSAMVWFKRTAQPNADQTVIANDASGSRNWSLFIRAHNAGTNPDCLEFLANGSPNVIVTAGTVPINEWCLVGFSYANGAVSVRLFRDASGVPLVNSGTSITIGSANPGLRVGNNGYNEYLTATLGPVRISAVSLPAEAFEYAWLNEYPLVTGTVLSSGYTPPPPGTTAQSGMNFGTLCFTPTVVPGVKGTDYTEAPAKAYDYYKGKGMGFIRVPFLWERITNGLNGAIVSTYFNYLKNAAIFANARGIKLLLDMHNYSMYRYSGTNYAIGSATVPASAFYDAWGKIAQAVVNDADLNTAVSVYGLMNEPHDNLWTSANAATFAQGAIDAIRAYDTTRQITIPGIQWSHSYEWDTRNSTYYDSVTDAQHKLLFEFHEYFWWPAQIHYEGLTWSQHWTGRSGTYFPNAASYISNPRLLAQDYLTGSSSAITWLAAYKSRTGNTWAGLYCGEIGFPDNALGLYVGDPGYVAQYDTTSNPWLIVQDEALKILHNNNVNWTWWQGGCNGWSNRDAMNLDPRNSDWTSNANAVDRPQMSDFVTWL